MAYTPKAEDIANLATLLDSGLSGVGARQMQNTFEEMQSSPQFCQLLTLFFASAQPLHQPLQFQWTQYRQIAGLTLKNSLEKASAALGLEAISGAATACVTVLQSETESSLTNPACQIVARLTSIAGIAWWASLNINLLDLLLNHLVGSQIPAQSEVGLRGLSYLLEDAAKKLGEAFHPLLMKLAEVSVTNPEAKIRRRAIEVLIIPFELGRAEDWQVQNFNAFQTALLQAAPTVAQCVTQIMTNDGSDANSHTTCLMMFAYLAEYFDNILVGAEAPKIAEYVKSWLQWSAQDIAAATNAEHALRACEFLDTVAKAYAYALLQDLRTPVVHVGPILDGFIPQLVPVLFPCMVIKPEHEQHKMETDHYSHRDLHTSHKLQRKFTSKQDDDLDAGELLSELRFSACHLLENLARINPKTTFEATYKEIQTRWGNADWHIEESALTALGSIVDGCSVELKTGIPAFVPHILGVIKTPRHVMSGSGAIWTLSQLFPTILGAHPEFMPEVITTLLGAMTSESKMMQSSATTGLKILSAADAAVSHILPHLQNCFAVLNQCLPVYHTNNLALLVDAFQNLITLIPHGTDLNAILAPFNAQLQPKSNEFFTTCQKRYGEHDQKQVVYKEMFEISRAIADTYKFHFSVENAAQALAMAQSWINVLQTLMSWDTSDDSEIVQYPLHLLCTLSSAMRVDEYRQISPTLVQLGLHFADHTSEDVKGTAVMLLFDAVHYLGEAGIPSIDAVITKLMPMLHVETAPALAVEAAGLLSEMFAVFGGTNPAMVQAAQLLGRQVRTDTIGTDHMPHIGQHLGNMLTAAPTLLEPAVLVNVMTVVAGTPNDDEFKQLATAGCVAAVQAMCSQAPAQVAAVVPSFMKLLFSWQFVMAEVLLPNVSNTLIAVNGIASAEMHTSMAKLSDNYRQQWCKYYKLM